MKCGLIVLGLAVCVVTTGVHADTYTCDAVDNIAKLGYEGNARVAVLLGNKECSFAIGDASVDAMEAERDLFVFPEPRVELRPQQEESELRRQQEESELGVSKRKTMHECFRWIRPIFFR